MTSRMLVPTLYGANPFSDDGCCIRRYWNRTCARVYRHSWHILRYHESEEGTFRNLFPKCLFLRSKIPRLSFADLSSSDCDNQSISRMSKWPKARSNLFESAYCGLPKICENLDPVETPSIDSLFIKKWSISVESDYLKFDPNTMPGSSGHIFTTSELEDKGRVLNRLATST